MNREGGAYAGLSSTVHLGVGVGCLSMQDSRRYGCRRCWCLVSANRSDDFVRATVFP